MLGKLEGNKWRAAGLSLKSVSGAASSLGSSVVTGLRASLDSLRTEAGSDRQAVTFVRFANLEYLSQVHLPACSLVTPLRQCSSHTALQRQLC